MKRRRQTERLQDARLEPPIVPADAEAGLFTTLPNELLVSVLSCRTLTAMDILSMRCTCLSLYSITHEVDFLPVMIENLLSTRASLRPTAMQHGPCPLMILAFLEGFPQCSECNAWSAGLKLTSGCCAHCYRLGYRAEVRLLRPGAWRALAQASAPPPT